MTSSHTEAASAAAEAPGRGGGAVRRHAWLVAAVLIVAGVANNARSLRWGFVYDDYFHQYALRGLEGGRWLRPWSLYDFSGSESLEQMRARTRMYFWWSDPGFKVRFFRPVTSASIWLDFLLYDDWAPGYHLTSLMLFAVFLTLAFKLYRALGAPPTAALWALAFLALEDSNCVPVGWIANRNALLAALFTVATVLCVQRHHQSGKRRHLLLALAWFLLAVGSKESGIVVLPLVVLYVLVFARPARGESAGGAALRLVRSRAIRAFTLLAAAYATFYFAAGYGTRSGLYASPWGDPGQYLARLGVLLPAGLQSLLFGFVTDIIPLHPQWTGLILAGIVPFLAVTGFVLLRTIGRTPPATFALGWILLTLLPEAGADLSDRLLIGASVGTALLIGLFFQRLGSLREQRAARRYARLALAGLLLLAGPLTGVPMNAVRSDSFAGLAASDRQVILNADIDRAQPVRDAFLLNSPSSMAAMSFLPTWSVHYADRQTRVFPLQLGRRPLSWRREDDRTATLTSNGSPLLAHRFEQLLRSTRATPAPGTRFQAPGFTATTLAVADGGVRRVRFTFDKSLDDPSYQFLAWRNGRLRRIAPPPIGGAVELPEVRPLSPFAP